VVIQIVEGTVESRIIRLLLEMYPVTLRDLERELSLRGDVLERSLKALVARGIVEVEPLPDRTYVRLLRRDFAFSGLKPSQRRRVRHHGGKSEKTKDYDGPILIHVITKKGKGYTPAENKPIWSHGVTAFDIVTGEARKSDKPAPPTYTSVFADALIEPEQKRHNRFSPRVIDRLGLGALHVRAIRHRQPGPSYLNPDGSVASHRPGKSTRA